MRMEEEERLELISNDEIGSSCIGGEGLLETDRLRFEVWREAGECGGKREGGEGGRQKFASGT